LNTDIALYGGLKLEDELALPILRGQQEVRLRKDAGKTKKQLTNSGISKKSSHTASNSEEELILSALKEQRTELAREQGVPPYIIFHDSTLLEMMKLRPINLEQFKRLNGVGQAKLEKYGRQFIEVIQSVQKKNDV